MDQSVYWYISGGFATLSTLLAVVYKITSKNTNRLNEHDVMFGKLDRIPDSIDSLKNKVDRLVSDVAVIKSKIEDK